jgi:hypothetical protein
MQRFDDDRYSAGYLLIWIYSNLMEMGDVGQFGCTQLGFFMYEGTEVSQLSVRASLCGGSPSKHRG